MASSSSTDDFIYHERQEAALCGQHALNNLVQASVFTAGYLSDIAQQLDQMELAYLSQNNEGGLL
jgi:Ataxin-3